jgi:hypothetical protein
MPVIPALRRQRQEDLKFEASLGKVSETSVLKTKCRTGGMSRCLFSKPWVQIPVPQNKKRVLCMRVRTSQVVKHLPSIHKALGSISCTTKELEDNWRGQHLPISSGSWAVLMQGSWSPPLLSSVVSSRGCFLNDNVLFCTSFRHSGLGLPQETIYEHRYLHGGAYSVIYNRWQSSWHKLATFW